MLSGGYDGCGWWLQSVAMLPKQYARGYYAQAMGITLQVVVCMCCRIRHVLGSGILYEVSLDCLILLYCF